MPHKKEDPEKHRSRARAYYQRMYSPQGPRYKFYKASSLRASKDYYARNRENIRSKQEQVQQEIRTWFRQYKKNIACLRCGERNAAWLHFHHRNSSEKVRNVGHNVYAASSLEKFIQELEKCDVLCANCHMIAHWEEWDEAAALYAYEELEQQLNEANGWLIPSCAQSEKYERMRKQDGCTGSRRIKWQGSRELLLISQQRNSKRD